MIDRCKFIHNLPCEQVSERITELESENASLKGAVQGLGELCDKYNAENAKLRKLVRYMHRCYVSGHDWGPWGAPERQHVEDIMRELGIEVPHD